MSALEYRFAPATVSGRTITGVAMKYGDVAELGAYREVVDAGAFQPLEDVILTFQHERARPLARTGGGGLELIDTPKALTIRATLPETRDGDDALTLLEKGVFRGLSVGMLVPPEGEVFSGFLRRIRDATLRSVGLVDRPAYREATAALAQRWDGRRRIEVAAWL